MSRNYLHIEELKGVPVSELEVEVVERKGRGHPDSLIDGACEAVSRGLSEHYLREYGAVLHHNVDKGLLVGGRSKPRFGGGEVLEPIYILVAGRATSFVMRGGEMEAVPIGDIAISSIMKLLKSAMRFLEPEAHVLVDYKIKQGSADLMSLQEASGQVPLCNDTSIGVGYAPFTSTERLVLEAERSLNSERMKGELPEIGEDVKVMAFRKGKDVSLTVAAAMISGLTPDKGHYISVIEEARHRLEDLAARTTDMNVDVRLNTADDYDKGIYYLTVTGTSAEAGDDGNTGRGNRPNGLISPMRQYSMEATAGKNPINHTGKIFNVLAQRASERIHNDVKGVREVYVRILSRIGVPINQPQIASAAVVLEKGTLLGYVRQDIEAIMEEELSRVTELTPQILSGSVTLF